MADSLELMNLKIAQQGLTVEQYRVNIYNIELKLDLLLKMLEEKGIFAKDEYNRRWPLYLKNDVGVIGPDGIMEGSCRIHFYGET